MILNPFRLLLRWVRVLRTRSPEPVPIQELVGRLWRPQAKGACKPFTTYWIGVVPSCAVPPRLAAGRGACLAAEAHGLSFRLSPPATSPMERRNARQG
jgi:hypothetical protein